MNVTATTFPRRSLSEGGAPSWVVSVKAGAGPIWVRRASGFGAWLNPGVGQGPSRMRRLAITDAQVGPFRPRLPSLPGGRTRPLRRSPVSQRSLCRPRARARGASHRHSAADAHPAHRTVGPREARGGGACAGVRSRAHPSLAFQLLLEVVKEPPVGAVGNQLLWTALHHPGFPQAERVEAHGLLGVVRSPAAERDLRHRLAGVLWRALEALVRKCPRTAARLHGAQPIAL